MASNNLFGKKGFTDRPAEKDDFNIQRYIGGLSTFIEKCNTPMTIAIQGDWGTGKTSIMSMIKKELESKNYNNLVWFNTWQFSQFNMGDSLPLLMMNKLVNSLGDNIGDAKNTIKNLVGGLASMAVGYASGGAVNIKEMFSTDFMEQFENLKIEFQKLVDKKAGEDGRVVIFVDDLDRLQPGRAVELLEVLKIFLDCEKCVFVLAIDYAVVSRGVNEKYGDSFSEEKGKSFFDKIIQVPFKMPVAEYDISNYVKNCFNEIGIEVKDDEVITNYVGLINHSIGNNPRSMKRLFNSYLLLSNIASDEILKSDENRQMLFAILCLQSRFENMYNYIVGKRNNLDLDDLNNLAEKENPVFLEYKMNENEIGMFVRFASDFLGLIDKDGDNNITDDELKAFRNVLSFSTITASGASEDTTDEEEWEKYRFQHKDKCRALCKIMSAKYNLTFKDYFRRTHEKGTWWTYIRNDEGYLDEKTGKIVKFGFECKLDPDYIEKCSIMTFNIYKIEPSTTEDIVSIMGENPLDKLGLKSNVNEWAINYDDVIRFDTDADIVLLSEIVIEAFEEVMHYFK